MMNVDDLIMGVQPDDKREVTVNQSASCMHACIHA